MRLTKLPFQGLPLSLNTIKLREQKFVKYFLICLALFLLYHLTVWFFWTSKIFGAELSYVGDLSRLGYQVCSIQERKPENTLTKRHLNINNYKDQKIDLITIGDSFSNGMAGGLNPYYQDFIATENNLTVLNIQNIKQSYNYIETIALLHNSGLLKKIKPKVVLIQSVQREMLTRFDRPIRWNLNLPLEAAKDNLFNRGWKPYVPPLKPVNTANYKLPYFSFLYNYSDNAFGKNKVYKLPLNKPLFSSIAKQTLLVYKDDINRLSQPTQENIQRINANFNYLAKLLQQHNIHLYVMPAVDKYDLYESYILNNNYSKNIFFDLLTPMNKGYTLVNTKKVLKPLIEQGVKDVFYADDTHWGPVASKHIAQSSYFKKLNHE